MARLPLHTLPTFRAVAASGNLRAAAQALHLTHSAVSQQIRLLEERLGFPVFDRQGRRIVLNPAGVALQRSVTLALGQLEAGVQAAAAAAQGIAQRLRVSSLPSFGQRWVLPRLGRWHLRHPDIAFELETSPQLVDLAPDGYHAALRQGYGHWPGLEAERLIDSPVIAVGAPPMAERLAGRGIASLLDEPLIGDAGMWSRWFAAHGVQAAPRPVADFTDFALLLQAAEQQLGFGLGRELLAADALIEGRLRRLSPQAITVDEGHAYYLVYPPSLRDWPPLVALRQFLHDELAASERALAALRALDASAPAPDLTGTGPADR